MRDLGLVVAVVGVGAAEGGVVHAAGGDGAAHWRVAARLATFRPSPGDVLDGQVVAAGSQMGLRVRLGRFFDDVFVPPDGLPSPSAFVPPNPAVRNAAQTSSSSTGGCWMYRPPPEEGETEADELEIAPGAAVRFRVREVRFERGPAPALAGGGKASSSSSSSSVAAAAAAAAASPSSSPSEAPFAPLVVIGDMDGVGLGPKSWWADEEDDEEEEEEGGAK